MADTDNTSKLATSGDSDLDFDIRDAVIDAVVIYGRDVIVTFSDGTGRFTNGAGGIDDTEPLHSVSIEMTAVFNTGTDELFDRYTTRLTTWRDNRTPLTVCSAPGKLTTIVENRSSWLPFPRSGTRSS